MFSLIELLCILCLNLFPGKGHGAESTDDVDQNHQIGDSDVEEHRQIQQVERKFQSSEFISSEFLSQLTNEYVFRRYSRSDDEIDLEERDARTIFCMQLSQRVRARDLEEFFSSVGKVRDVRLITCNKTKRFKGIAYIEFKNSESVSLVSALIRFGLNKFFYSDLSIRRID